MVCWIINQYINTPEDPGSSRHYELAKALYKNGYQIVLIGAKKKRTKGLFYVEEREGFKIIWININKYYGKSYIRIINILYF